MIASWASLARVTRIYRLHFHTGKRRLIFNIPSQLRKCPLTHAISLLLPEPCPASDALKVFDGYSSTGVCSFRNDLFCNRMVGIRFKSSLSTRDRFQFTFGVQRPFAASFLLCRFLLKRSFHLFIMLSRSLDIIALMHLAVAINGQIYNAEIHSDEIGRSYRLAIRSLNTHKQKPSAVLAPEEIALAVFSVESLGLVFAHDNWNDGPAFEGQQGNTVIPFERHQPLVVRDAGVFPEARANGFISAIGFANLSDTADGHLRGEAEVITQLSVVELLKFDLVSDLEAESFACEPIGGVVESPNRGGKLFRLISIGQQLCLQGQLHGARF
jgi:hypothetical protein